MKLDFIRVISVLYPDGRVDFFSRNGKELVNFRNLQKELSKCIETNPIDSAIVLDGEVVSKNFQELMKQIHRKNTAQNEMQPYLFDILLFESFKSGIEKNILKELNILKTGLIEICVHQIKSD